MKMKRREAIRAVLGSSVALAGALSQSGCSDSNDGSVVAGGVGGGGGGGGTSGPEFGGEIGITTGGFNAQRESGELNLENLPAFLNGELGMRLIDVNTRWFTAFNQRYVEACRDLAAASGCIYTNLKVNHRISDLYAADAGAAALAMAEARSMVDAAHWLGARWIRFTLPQKLTLTGDLPKHRELADYAAEKSVQLLVENGGWMRESADSIVRGVAAIGGQHAAAPAPDTGNWDDAVRDEGLRLSFPGAVSCDFKVFDLDADGLHAKYDIRRCFDIGWQSGYRGPWLLEHWNDDSSALVRDLLLLRDQLRAWMREGAAA